MTEQLSANEQAGVRSSVDQVARRFEPSRIAQVRQSLRGRQPFYVLRAVGVLPGRNRYDSALSEVFAVTLSFLTCEPMPNIAGAASRHFVQAIAGSSAENCYWFAFPLN